MRWNLSLLRTVYSFYRCKKKKKKKKKKKQFIFITKSFSLRNNLLGGSKVLQYFGNVRQNSADLNAFAEVVKVMNNTGRYDAELA